MIQITDASRDMDSPDATFIADTWLKSYLSACNGGDRRFPAQDMAQHLVRNMDDQQYFSIVRPHVHRLMTDPNNQLLLASMEEDRDLYVGWACGRRSSGPYPAVLHYVYVKQRHRREGVGYTLLRELLGKRPTAQGMYTCLTWEWFQIILDASNVWTYRPNLASEGAAKHDQQNSAQTTA